MPYGHAADDFVHDLRSCCASEPESEARWIAAAPLLALLAVLGVGGLRAGATSPSREEAVRDSEGHLGAAHGGRQGRDPAVARSA